MEILFIQTGGTIDKDYPHTTQGWAFEFGEPATTRILERLSPSFQYDIVTACQKDSLEITKAHREAMLACIKARPYDGYVLTHGTDTLLETAAYLAKRLQDQKVVLTGAMRPERFTNSDAPLNLGMAIAALQLIPSGVHVAMHGIVKPHNAMQRNLDSGAFY